MSQPYQILHAPTEENKRLELLLFPEGQQGNTRLFLSLSLLLFAVGTTLFFLGYPKLGPFLGSLGVSFLAIGMLLRSVSYAEHICFDNDKGQLQLMERPNSKNHYLIPYDEIVGVKVRRHVSITGVDGALTMLYHVELHLTGRRCWNLHSTQSVEIAQALGQSFAGILAHKESSTPVSRQKPSIPSVGKQDGKTKVDWRALGQSGRILLMALLFLGIGAALWFTPLPSFLLYIGLAFVGLPVIAILIGLVKGRGRIHVLTLSDETLHYSNPTKPADQQVFEIPKANISTLYYNFSHRRIGDSIILLTQVHDAQLDQLNQSEEPSAEKQQESVFVPFILQCDGMSLTQIHTLESALQQDLKLNS